MNIPALTLDIPLNIGGVFPYAITGQFVRCVASSEDFLLSIDDAVTIPFTAGQMVRMETGDKFQKITISAKPTAAINPNPIRLIVGNGDFRDDRVTFTGSLTIAPGQSVTSKSATTLFTGNVDAALVAATNTLVATANVNRRAVRVRNLSTVDFVRLATNPADLTAGKGYYLGAGEDASFDITGDLYARSTGTPTLNTSEEIY